MRGGKLIRLIIFSLALSFYGTSYAQEIKGMRSSKSTVCYGMAVDHNVVIPPPAQYIEWQNNPHARTQTATFDVTYVGFTAEAKAAFQKAVDIWSTLLKTSQIIHVHAEWKTLDAGVLGSASWANAFANFPGAPQVDTFYPVALAEKIANKELNGSTDADIFANFSSSANWSYDLNGATTSGKYDLVTVVLHELGHGLGFVDSYTSTGELGSVGLNDAGNPIIYDLSLENGANQNLFVTYTSPSATLAAQLVSKNIFYNSPQVLASNNNAHAKIYAPATFSGGSSISHLDETTFNGSADALMTPQINSAEAIHDPGSIVKAMFSDMGWVFTRIEHNKLLFQENIAGPFVVTAKVTSDLGNVTKPVFLVYNTGGADAAPIQMTATANANEYTATIPSTNAATTYSYYISASDELRTYTNPGKLTKQGAGVKQTYFIFKTGPDTEPPVIVHTPKEFIRSTDTALVIESKVTDNLGVENVALQYLINDVPQPTKKLFASSLANDLYSFTITFANGSLHNGDIIKYRIIATDTAVVGNANGNIAYSPTSTSYYSVSVIGLKPAQDYYSNNFNVASTDFYGEGFSIETPAGFSNGCINSEHPYKEGHGFSDNVHNTYYQLFVPIKVKAKDATIKFDEIVLVEPGQSGSEFGSEDFFDYVVVEGSTDGGTTWTTVADGYDSRDNADWLTRYNSGTTDGNSTGVGDPTLYKKRTLNLLGKFSAGQEVLIRFRLYSDPYSAGWGWAIDNLEIQIDSDPPRILHNHVDYILPTAGNYTLPINTKVTDASGVKSIAVLYKVNDGDLQTYNFPETDKDLYTLTINLPGLAKGDKIQYKITAVDNAKYLDVDLNNTTSLPANGFITVVAFEPGTPVSQYINDFNTTSTDFIGNFFTINKPDGFTDNAIHSEHFYSLGFGTNLTSSFCYMLTKPVTLSATNPYMRFDEIAIVEGHSVGTVFGTDAFNDYVIAEGSTDGGVTWKPFLDGYDDVVQSSWVTAFNAKSNGTKAMFKPRSINLITQSGFRAGDNVVIRFRLFSDQVQNGWGWAIDNLAIQAPVTATEKTVTTQNFKLYPNPARSKINIEFEPDYNTPVTITLVGTTGATVLNDFVNVSQNSFHYEIDLTRLPAGLYLVKLQTQNSLYVSKLVVEK